MAATKKKTNTKKKTINSKNTDHVPVKEILDPELVLEKRVINSRRSLKKIVRQLKDAGFRIVLTQGVWDLIHEGHARFLEKSKSYGDILIVGVDSDALTRQRKGPRRPIVPEIERIRMISHLRHVDLITIRDIGEDIGELIRVIEPDVLVVSKTTKDFTKNMKDGYKNVCGQIINLKHQATTTTTGRIRNLSIEGAEDLAGEIQSSINRFLGGSN